MRTSLMESAPTRSQTHPNIPRRITHPDLPKGQPILTFPKGRNRLLWLNAISPHLASNPS